MSGHWRQGSRSRTVPLRRQCHETRLLKVMIARQRFRDFFAPITTNEMQSVSDHALSGRSS